MLRRNVQDGNPEVLNFSTPFVFLIMLSGQCAIAEVGLGQSWQRGGKAVYVSL